MKWSLLKDSKEWLREHLSVGLRGICARGLAGHAPREQAGVDGVARADLRISYDGGDGKDFEPNY